MNKYLVILFLAFVSISSGAQDYDHFLLDGNNSYHLQNWKDAIQLYSKAYNTDIGNLADFNSANAYYRLADFNKSIQYYKKTAENKNTDAKLRSNAYNNLGLTYIQLQQLDNAILAFRQALILSPSDNDIRDNLQKALTEKKENNLQKKQTSTTPTVQNISKNITTQKMNELQQKEKRSLKKMQHGAQKYERNGGKDW